MSLSLANIIAESLENLAYREGVYGILLSGGVDSTFVALSMHGLGIIAITSVSGAKAPDLPFAKVVAERLGLEHVVAVPSLEEVERCMELAIRVAKSVDPVEIACDAALCVSLSKARELGVKKVATGDGGDELFLGYSFLLEKNVEDLSKWLQWVVERAAFPSVPIGRELGVEVVPALFSSVAIAISKLVPIGDRVSRVGSVKVGKALLRRFLAFRGFPEVAIRNKTPVLVGSGFNSLVEAWREGMELSRAVGLCKKLGIALPSRAHAYLALFALERGIDVLALRLKGERSCPICGSALIGNSFCRFCGAYVNGNAITYHFRDELLDALKSSRRLRASM